MIGSFYGRLVFGGSLKDIVAAIKAAIFHYPDIEIIHDVALMDSGCMVDVMTQSQETSLIKSAESINDIQNDVNSNMISETSIASEIRFTPNYSFITGRVINKEVSSNV
jgi:nitrate reductase NapAB chaperone NapD